MYQKFWKRIFDLIFASIGLLLLIIPGLIISIIIRITSLEHVFFLQKRAGKHGKIFHIIKFRTMRTHQNKISTGRKTKNQYYIPFGIFLRRWKLDEIPQLWNVLLGQMSVVGPRPLLVKYLDRYNPEQARRHNIKPGITGWAQVNGGNTITWEERFKYDVWYTKNMNFWLDIKIILMTITKISKKEAIFQPEYTIIGEFKGTKFHV